MDPTPLTGQPERVILLAREDWASKSAASECAHLEKLVSKYGSKLPATYLAHLPKFPQPPAGPLTNAIILSWVSAEGHWPHVDYKGHRHWPTGLRLLHWVFSGQQAVVWDNLDKRPLYFGRDTS
jgi:hypothetical protein